MLRIIGLTGFLLLAQALEAGPLEGRFASIDGGDITLQDWRGRPVLVVNTASQCAFSAQYEGLQRLYDRYRDQGLVVLAVPSDDFDQELATGEEVKAFCTLTYGIDLPMTDITPVLGSGAHPFYQALAADHGFAPRWNFNKVLISPDGELAATWGSTQRPQSRRITTVIESHLN